MSCVLPCALDGMHDRERMCEWVRYRYSITVYAVARASRAP